MTQSKQVSRKKTPGFLLTLLLIVLSVATAGMYVIQYGNYAGMMSWPAVALLAAGAVVAILFILIKRPAWAYAPLAIGASVALLMYIEAVYGYVMVVLIGIDLNEVSQQFIICTALFVVTFVLSLINIFVTQEKEVEAK